MYQRNRRSIRLKGYDYSQEGAYYITICVEQRLCLFGSIDNSEMILNDAGRMVEKEWLNLKERFPYIELHEYVVMPDHFHGILEITNVGAPLVGVLDVQNRDVDNPKPNESDIDHSGQPQGMAPAMVENSKNKTLGDMMDAFKSITTVEYIRGVKNKGWQSFNRRLWQCNYWEHIIRNDNDFNRISNYIKDNPSKWNRDNLS